MLEKIKNILGMEASEEKAEKLHFQLAEYANQKFQVAEWAGKLYITVDHVPIKNSFENIQDLLSELEIYRETWVSFMESHEDMAKRLFTI